MRIDPEDLRRHYESLSDEGLLDIDRDDLAPVAQGIYDQEVARRGLDRLPEGEEEDGSYGEFTVDEDGGYAGEPASSESEDGPPPDWLEDAGCPWSSLMSPGVDYAGNGAEVQAALRAAGIPSRTLAKPPEPPGPQGPPLGLYCVLVPGELTLRACNVVERKVFNPQAEADWRSHLTALSDDELRGLKPEDFCGALLDRAERLKRAYREEIARRELARPAR